MDDTCKYSPCPLGVEVGFTFCHWWTKNGCTHPSFAQVKQLEDKKAMEEASRLYKGNKR